MISDEEFCKITGLSTVWVPKVFNFGSGIHVYPQKRISGIENWENLIDFPWYKKIYHALFTCLKYTYPKNEKDLELAIKYCQQVCHKLNKEEEKIKEIHNDFLERQEIRKGLLNENN